MGSSSSRERRLCPDRRRRPTPPLSKYIFLGSRRGPRRASDPDRNYYVDRYSPKALIIILLILIMCVFDGLITLRLVKKGAEELNPLMNFFLSLGGPYFLSVKYLVTFICVLVLLIHKNFYLFNISIKHIILWFFVLYGLLIAYELWLLV